jgi:uncharacterized membrane protein YqjE
MDAPVPPETPAAEDPPQALRGILALFIESLRTRVDLAAVEFEIYLRTLLRALLWAVSAVTCALLALAFGVTAVIVALWDTHRTLGCVGGFALFVVLAVLFGWLGVRTVSGQGGVLEGSLQQLHEDERKAGGIR